LKLVYYITSHGYGHAVRSCAICNCLSPQTQLVVRTLLPEAFFKYELTRPFTYAPRAFDCGCVQPDGVTVDVERTIAAYKKIADANAAALAGEAQWLVDNGIDGIVSDIAPFAFEAARRAGIASVAATNFTWYDIYKEYCEVVPDFLPYLEKIKTQYGLADLLLALERPISMDYFKSRKRVGVVGRVGRMVREKIIAAFGVLPGKRLGLIYTGTFGMDSMAWQKLEGFREWEFFGIYPLPGNPANYHRFSKDQFRYQDLIASVDVMVAKIGYGVYAECLLNGAPLLYLPREGFAEYPVLDAAIRQWGSGYCLSREEYYALKWEVALDAVVFKKRPMPVPSDGAPQCAKAIEELVEKLR